jgi:hypothetical protein
MGRSRNGRRAWRKLWLRKRWREAAGWTRNLAWQYAINLAWDRECEKIGGTKAPK